MSMNSPDYLSYKKSKINPEEKRRRSSGLKIAFLIFIITFSVIFAIVVQVIRKYSARIDIEYDRNLDSGEDAILQQSFGNDVKKAIDRRLRLIQLEENAPNEAKVVEKQNEDTEVIDIEQFEQIKKQNDETDVEQEDKKTDSSEQKNTQADNIQVYSKVLIGKYQTFDDAVNAQESVRGVNQGSTPFIRKVGDIYALQVGSFQDLNVARQVAAKYRAEDFDVWIYQQ